VEDVPLPERILLAETTVEGLGPSLIPIRLRVHVVCQRPPLSRICSTGQ
jgi:hypothetical protein